MKLPPIKFPGGKGVNKDQLSAELELGVWSDANNFRFRNGFDEKVGGIAEIMTSPSVTSYSLFTYQTTTKRFVIEQGTAKAYCHDGTTRTQITPAPAAKTVSSIVDKTGTGPTRILTTATAHGLSTGDKVQVYGCTGTDANKYNTERYSWDPVIGSTITVTSTTAFEYSGYDASTPAGAAAGSPAYVVLSTSTVTDFTGGVDDRVTGGHLAGMLILNNPVNGLFYWNGDTTTKLRPFTVTNYVADVGRPFKEWFVQLAPTQSGTKYPRRVLWSSAAEPGSLPASFDASSSNDAGNVELDDTNGFLIDCLPWGDVNHIYKEDERYTMRWIGGNEVFQFTQVGDPNSLMARGCIANAEVGQVFLTKSCDVRIHQGGMSKSLAEGRIRKYLQGDIDSTYKARAFLETNPYTKEIWVFYPRSGSSTCNGAVFWNWENDTWGIAHRGLNITCATSGLLPTTIATERRMVIATSTPKLGLVDSGTTDLGATITATLERTGLHFDGRNRKKTLHTSRIDADATANNTVTVYHGSHTRPHAAASYGSGVTYTQDTTRDVNSFASSAEYAAWKLSTTATDWKQRNVELEVTAQGNF